MAWLLVGSGLKRELMVHKMNKSLKKGQLAKKLADLSGAQNNASKKYERDFTKQDLLALLEWANDTGTAGSDLKTKINEKKTERESVRSAKRKAKSSSQNWEIIRYLFFVLLILAVMIKSCYFSDSYTLEDHHRKHPLQKNQYDRNKIIRDAYKR